MKIVIAGASLAGFKTAAALREFGFTDEIVLVGEETAAPYDRPPLSKTVLTSGDDLAEIALTPPDVDLGLQYMLGCRASSLDLEARSIGLEDGQSVDFDVLVVATGASARRLPWPEIDGICYLRTLDDARKLRRKMALGPRVVVIGGGFIGAEAAAAARHLGLEVTILEAGEAPLARVLGAEVGSRLGRLHMHHGVDLRCGVAVTGVEGERRVTGVRLATGEVIPADLVVVGIGAVPATDWLESSGLILEDGLVCDEFCRAEGAEGVYAVGDVARWMNPVYGETMRIEHWTNVVEQAAAVAQTIVGEPEAYGHIPYVWSHQYSHKIQMVGRIIPGHESTFVGPTDDGAPFVAIYSEVGKLTGAVALDLPRAIPKIKRLISSNATTEDAKAFAEGLFQLAGSR